MNCNLTEQDRKNGMRCRSWDWRPCNDLSIIDKHMKEMNEKSNEEKWREECADIMIQLGYSPLYTACRTQKEYAIYLAGRKAEFNSEEYYKARYEEAARSANEMNLEINTLRAENEKLRQDISGYNFELEALKEENERLKSSLTVYSEGQGRMANDPHNKEEMTTLEFFWYSKGEESAQKIIDALKEESDSRYFEIKRLKDLLKRAKPWVALSKKFAEDKEDGETVEFLDEWIKDSEVICE